ncbi:MAG: hypothetical protein ACFCA4_13795 [Cyanophyceae cyanobacterium]
MNKLGVLCSFTMVSLAALCSCRLSSDIVTTGSLPKGCPESVDSLIAYQRRDGNRCEGIFNEPISSPKSAQIKSLHLGRPPEAWDLEALKIQIYDLKPTDRLEIEFPNQGYLINRFTKGFTSEGFAFEQPTRWLSEANVDAQDFNARAEQVENGQVFYLPVILDDAADETYYFQIRFNSPLELKTYAVQLNDKVIYSEPGNPNISLNIITFKWTPERKYPADVYTLSLTPADGDPVQFKFRHNPDWLR